jgi:hypothetical protein
MLTSAEVRSLDQRFDQLPTEEILSWASEHFGSSAAIGTSFQGAGLVMMYLAKQKNLRFPVFTLDTGLLFQETLDLQKRLEDFFGYKIESLVPDLRREVLRARPEVPIVVGEQPMVLPYIVDGQRYAHIKGFGKHQRQDNKSLDVVISALLFAILGGALYITQQRTKTAIR